jgi:hypothetical protein
VNYLNGETANELSIDRLNIVHGGKGDGTGGGDGKGTGGPAPAAAMAWDGFAMPSAPWNLS